MRAKLTGSHLADWLDRLEADHDNLLAALDRLAQSDEPAAFLRLSRSLALFPDGRSLYVLDFGVSPPDESKHLSYGHTGVLWRVTRV